MPTVSDTWEARLEAFLEELQEAIHLRENERPMEMIPVTLPNGTLSLTPGGQNDGERNHRRNSPKDSRQADTSFTYGTRELAGATSIRSTWLAWVFLDEAGRMPDVVIHSIETDWLVIIEAKLTSHGPVNALRHGQLGPVCGLQRASCSTAFLDRVACHICGNRLGN